MLTLTVTKSLTAAGAGWIFATSVAPLERQDYLFAQARALRDLARGELVIGDELYMASAAHLVDVVTPVHEVFGITAARDSYWRFEFSTRSAMPYLCGYHSVAEPVLVVAQAFAAVGDRPVGHGSDLWGARHPCERKL